MQRSESDSANLLTAVPALCIRARDFVLHDLWAEDLESLPIAQRLVLQPLRVILIALRGFFIDHSCLLRASALTNYTFLALVPMLAFSFAFLKGLGVQNTIEPWLNAQLPSGSEAMVEKIIEFINNIKVGTLGAVSLGLMIFTTFLQLGTIEQALNSIWDVDKGRSIVRKLSDYVSVLVLGPVLLTVVLGAGNQPLIAKLLEQRLIGYAITPLLTILPGLLAWLAFSFGYAYMPNTRVRLIPALVGGLVGSVLWQLAKWGYITLQIGVVRSEAIYGAFAVLPVFLLWLQISWLVVLLGAELTFATQYVLAYPVDRFASGIKDRHTSTYMKEWLANELYFSLIQSFKAGTGPWSATSFARQQRVPITVIREIISTLVEDNLLVEVAETPEHYVPGRDPATITPWHVLRALRHRGEADATTDLTTQYHSPTTPLMMQVEAASRQVAEKLNFNQWFLEAEQAHIAQNSPRPDNALKDGF